MAKVFYEVVSGSQKIPVYDASAHSRLDAIATDIDGKLDITATDAWDIAAYTAGDNINITDHVISGKNWVTEIAEASASTITAIKEKFDADDAGITGYDGVPIITPSGSYTAVFQEKGDYVSASDLQSYYTKTEVDTLIDPFTTSAEVDEKLADLKTAIDDAYGSLFNTSLKAGDNIVIASAEDTTVKLVEYTINGPFVSANKGLSASYDADTNTYELGVEFSDAGFAKYSTSANKYTASAKLTGYTELLNLNESKISLKNDSVTIQPGLYHVDLQTSVTLTAIEPNYYSTTIKSINGGQSTTKTIDASYIHSESIDLSFDIRITDEDSPLEISIEGFQPGGTCAIANLNIHEIISMPSKVTGGEGGNYVAGEAIAIAQDTISVNYGQGLHVPVSSHQLEVKLGTGLTFADDHGIQAIVVDDKVADVVESVEKLSDDLDSKLTTNFDMALITQDYDFANGGVTMLNNGNTMLFQAFTVPINNPIRLENDTDGPTTLGVYAKQGYTNKFMLALYCYNFNENKTDYVCDTGLVTAVAGRNEYPILHINPKYTELKSDNVYYAALYLPAGHASGLLLAGCPGYANTFNAIPKFTIGTENLSAPAGVSEIDRLDYNDGEGNYTIGPWSNGYNEKPAAPRFFLQIRNKQKTTSV